MSDDLTTFFQNLLGPAHVLTADAERAGYETGWRGEKGKAKLVLRPKTTSQISEIMRRASAEKLRIIAQGANTGLVDASTPDETGQDIILSLDRMTDILSIDPLNRSAHVQAGCRLSRLNSALAEHDLFYPIDLSADPSLGGMLATNTGGGRLLKYGGVRENTFGLKVVLADENGTILDLLCPLHKNNAGLDLKHLFIGTGGTFGVITECMLRLSIPPKQTATALLIPRSITHINLLLEQIEKHCNTMLSALELMSGAAIRAALENIPNTPNPFGLEAVPDYALLLEIARTWEPRDTEQPLAQGLEHIVSLLWGHEAEPLETALLGDPHKLWALRHALSEGVQKSGKLYAFDISFRRGDVMPFLEKMRGHLPDAFPGISICDFGHIGDGGIHFNLILPEDDPRTKDPDFEPTLRRSIFDCVVTEFNGSFSAEHGLGRKNQSYYDLYTPAEIRKLTASIRAVVSPAAMGAFRF